ncbi:MAG: ABC transporter substrate-binding protein [Chloroflexi bacterium]|nr:ABC transporter substrate-binding protein [Chloroflexota bacterium]
MRPPRRRLAPAIAVVMLAAAACGSTPSASPAAEPVPLTVGLGYIPSVQFAQFYLADQAGYYADAGLDVTLQNQIDPDLITLLGQGAVDIGSGDGTSVIPAVSQGIPVVYTSTIYGRFPAVVIARSDSGIATAADLKGKRIGTPGKYGTSWIMLQALLGSAGLTTEDVTIVEFPDYSQAAALEQGQVDAVTGFANNEPIQMVNAGMDPVVLTVDDVVPLPGPGLVTGTETLAAKADALKAFTAATLRAMETITADPQAGLDATFAAIPDLAADPALQRQILDATIATWQTRTGAPLGAIDRDGWQQSLDFMTSLGLVPNAVTVDQLVNESLLP